jgi:hypothetical protein
MKDFNITGISSLSHEELKTIDGGDPFLRDLGKAFGAWWGALGNTIAYGLEFITDSCSSTSGSSDSWMLSVPPLTLFQ